MKTIRFEVLSQAEVERIHAASMEILSTVGVQVDWPTAQDLLDQLFGRRLNLADMPEDRFPQPPVSFITQNTDKARLTGR